MPVIYRAALEVSQDSTAGQSVAAAVYTDQQDEHRRSMSMIIRLEARLQPNIGVTFERVLTVFTRSDMSPPKVNQFR